MSADLIRHCPFENNDSPFQKQINELIVQMTDAQTSDWIAKSLRQNQGVASLYLRELIALSIAEDILNS